MARIFRFLSMALAVGTLSAALAPTACAQGGEWSNHAAVVPMKRTFLVPSPDRKRALVADGGLLAVREQGIPVPGGEGIDVLQSAEVLWAPDSKAFVVTANDGSDGGGWDISVFVLEHDRCNYYRVTADAVDRFRQQHACGDEEPNVGAVKWIKGSQQLLIAVEIPRRSPCKDRGASAGYVVNVPSGTIAVSYDQARLAEDWGEALGSRFSRRAP